MNGRQKVWLALSELYLDTELDDSDYKMIIRVSEEASFGLKDLRRIDYYEVMPAVGTNLISMTGVWSGFDPDWLFNECEKNSCRRRSFWFRLRCCVLYIMLVRARSDSWLKLEKAKKSLS